jgi:hypothetical protein
VWALMALGQKPSRTSLLSSACVEFALAVNRARLWSDSSICSVLLGVTGGTARLRGFDLPRWSGRSSEALVRGESADRLPSTYQRFLYDCRKVKAEDVHGNFVCAAKFLCIHPFVDGNGRTARFLLAASLSRAVGDFSIAASIVQCLFVEQLPRFIAAAEKLSFTGDESSFRSLLREICCRHDFSLDLRK